IEGSRIAVTGATGFIGRHIVESLLAAGADVVAVVRNPDKVPEFRRMGIEFRIADLGDRIALTRGFRGVDAVISNAALFRMSNSDWDGHRQANVVGTANVIRAVADAGVTRVVHVSSVAVYKSGGSTPIGEDWPMLEESDLGMFNAYSVSKAVSEREAWKLASKLGLALSCCRPSSVFGPFDPNITPTIARVLSLPVAPIPHLLRAGLVYAGDVADGTLRILRNDSTVGKSYNLTGPHSTSGEFFHAWKDAGGPWPGLAIPVPVPLTRIWNNQRAERELGWKNRSWQESLCQTFERQPFGRRKKAEG
ncbi:MAG TPA: SDR family NAD(P)-dependent oxidoreductase, partial [Myxococcota bacterium]|nr:SDR family NAD(P)-dependent oxidoreductase [Myxococcota bacterium]